MGNCEQTSRREFAQIGLPGGFRKVCATRTFGLQGRFWAGGPGANLYCVWNRPRSLDRLAPLGIYLDLAGQPPAHDAPTHPDGQEQTERDESQVGKGRRAVPLEDAPLAMSSQTRAPNMPAIRIEPPSPSDRHVAWSTTTQPASRSRATMTFTGPIASVLVKRGAMAQ